MKNVVKTLRDNAEKGLGLSPAIVRYLAQETYKEWDPEFKPIDKVTTEDLKKATTMVGIHIPGDVLDKIIDLVELLEQHGDRTSLKDLSDLQKIWDEA